MKVPGGDSGVNHILAMMAWNTFVIDKCLRRDSVDILFQADIFGTLLPRKNQPIVSAVHGIGHWFFTTSRSTACYFHTLYKRVLNNSDMIIAISNSTLVDLIQTLNVPARKIRLVYNGIDQEYYCQKIEWSAAIAGLGIKSPYIVYSGTVRVSKNVTNLIEAFSRLSSRYPNIANRVLMLVHLPNDVMPYLYTGSNVFAFPSLYEGHSLALLEAMACGCPILTSNFGSMLETVGDTALCVNSYSVESIAEGLDQLLSNSDLRKKMGAAARERVRRWTPKACAEGTLNVLEEAWRQFPYRK
jgi:glycosyltransferase involved in cell wall biosynthesis